MGNDVLTEMERQALLLIRRGQAASRAEVSRRLHVSRPTASLIVEKLIEVRALCEIGPGKARRGKSPTLLAPAAQYQYTIGLDLGYTRQLVGVLLDGKNRIVRRAETEFDSTSLDSIREKAMAMIETFSRAYTVSGIGIALPGIIDPASCEVVHSVNPLFASSPICELFAQWTQLPVTVENRSRTAAFSEAFGGAADQQQNFILCSLGKSIGAAFWLNGTVFQGASGAAGEIRCIRLTDGRTLEEALSWENASRASENELVSLCAEGLYQLTQIMDLGLFVLTGRFTDFSAGFLQKLTRALSSERECRVVFSNYGRFSAARGAAMSIAEKTLPPGKALSR